MGKFFRRDIINPELWQYRKSHKSSESPKLI
jgi:hypothetical protein